MIELSEIHHRIREVITIAQRAHVNGNRPFAALLISSDGKVLAETENSQLTDGQVLAHAEMNLLHYVVKQHTREVLAESVLYTSAEPCAMCAGAIFWSGIGHLVFGLSGERLHELADFTPEMLVTSARDVLANAGRQVQVTGPVLESEAEVLFKDGVI